MSLMWRWVFGLWRGARLQLCVHHQHCSNWLRKQHSWHWPVLTMYTVQYSVYTPDSPPLSSLLHQPSLVTNWESLTVGRKDLRHIPIIVPLSDSPRHSCILLPSHSFPPVFVPEFSDHFQQSLLCQSRLVVVWWCLSYFTLHFFIMSEHIVLHTSIYI